MLSKLTITLDTFDKEQRFAEEFTQRLLSQADLYAEDANEFVELFIEACCASPEFVKFLVGVDLPVFVKETLEKLESEDE